jgi:hypothetical protein
MAQLIRLQKTTVLPIGNAIGGLKSSLIPDKVWILNKIRCAA